MMRTYIFLDFDGVLNTEDYPPLDFEDIDLSCEEPTPEMMVGKGRDVKSFLSRIKSPYNYVILDDVPDFFPEQMSHYVQVNPKVGIDEKAVEAALKILKAR